MKRFILPALLLSLLAASPAAADFQFGNYFIDGVPARDGVTYSVGTDLPFSVTILGGASFADLVVTSDRFGENVYPLAREEDSPVWKGTLPTKRAAEYSVRVRATDTAGDDFLSDETWSYVVRRKIVRSPRMSLQFAAEPNAPAPTDGELGFAVVGVDVEPDSDALNGAEVTARVSGTGFQYVYADWTQGKTTVRLYLSDTGITDDETGFPIWAATLPSCHAGRASVVVTAEDELGRTHSYPSQDYTIAENTSNANQGLTNRRYPNMDGWTEPAGYLGTLDSNWYGASVRRISGATQMIRIIGTTDTNEVPTHADGAVAGFVRTNGKLVTGVGSIWFKAKMATTNALGGTLVIDKITSVGSGINAIYTYHKLAEVSVPQATAGFEWYQFHLIIQDSPATTADRAYYRIRNNTQAADSSMEAREAVAVDLQDIVLTPVIPDVEVYKDEADYSPGYPSVLDPIEFHISVSNRFASAPAANFTPKLVWRQKSGIDWDDWTETPMTNRMGRTDTGDGTYACVLTDKDITDGAFEYFYEVDFTGYTPTFPAIKSPQDDIMNLVVNDRVGWGVSYLIHTNALALLTDANGNVNEGRSPAYYPDFKAKYLEGAHNSAYANYAQSFDIVPGTPAETSGSWWDFTSRFDLHELDLGWPVAQGTYMVLPTKNEAVPQPRTIEVEAEYKYMTFLAPDGIRRFRSHYNGVAAVTRDLSEDLPRPEWLDFAYPMQHVGDYTWQAIIPMSGAIDHFFSVTGAMYHAEGATAYDPGPYEWLQLDQKETDINPPMNGDLAGRSHLRRFQAYPTNLVSTVWGVTNYVEYTPTWTTGTYVGLVTNELEEGQAPTEADVVYWHRRLHFDYDRATGYIQTNAVTVEENYWVSEDNRSVEILERRDFASIISDVDNGRGGTACYVTNQTRVAESIDQKRITEKVPMQQVRTVYEPSDEDLEAEGEAEWTAYHPGEGAFPGWQSTRTRVQIDYAGFLMYRFCTTNGSWQIRRAAWQDFNTWQADNSKYSRSFGIYDMKTFESDLEGRDLTEFENNLDFSTMDDNNLVPATTGWSDSLTNLYWNGFAGTGMRIVQDRTPAKAGSRSRNASIWLNTHPTKQGPGHLETTMAQRGAQGRGTFALRVRSASDDDRNVTWKAAGEMQDYMVVARIANPAEKDVSDAEHSLSLIGYYEDPFNYWEARIIQKSWITGDTRRPERTWFEVHIYKWTEGDCREVFGKVSHKNMWGDQNYTVNDTKLATFPGWSGATATGARNNNYWDNPAKDGTFLRTSTGGWTFAFEVKTEGGVAKPALYAFYTDDLTDPARQAEDKRRYFKYDASAASNLTGGSTKGRPGYNMRDCGLKINPYAMTLSEWNARIGTANLFTYSTAAELGTMCASLTGWDFSDKATYDRDQKINVWAVESDSTISYSNPIRLTRPAPKVWYRVKVYRTQAEETEDFMAPIGKSVSGGGYASWREDWDAYHGAARKDGPQSVESWKWTPVEIPLSFWDETFLNVSALPDDGSSYDPSLSNEHMSHGVLAVDDLSCDEWRGVTVYDEDYRQTAAPERNETDSFVATYAAIAADGRTGRRYELNRSRANPRKSQSIDTPLLVRGVGDVLFSYRVEGSPVEVAVRVVNESGTKAADLFATNLPVGAAGTLYVPCLSNITGRLRIEARTPEYAAEGALGTVFVDNVRATDYPVTGDTSWEVYNALVSSFPDRRAIKFDGTSEGAASYRSMVLNDGVRKDTLQDHTFDEHVPFVQTPSIETGVGEVSFWYRAAPENGGRPAKISLMVADTSRRPDGPPDWHELTADDLSWDDKTYGQDKQSDPNWQEQAAQLAALSSVTNSRWKYFNVEFYQKDYRVLRVVTGDPDMQVSSIPERNRVMLDNVLITEPVRASIDVGSIEFLPSIPLSTKPTGAKVTLVNPRMGPENINVYLDWFVAQPDAELEPFPIRTVTVDSYEKAIPMYTNIVIEGESIRVNWTRYQTIAVTNLSTEITRLSPEMKDDAARKWGYDAWKGDPRMREIAFTNAPGDAYTFYSTDTIPTDTFPADTVFQYCVRVEYTGKFSSDVLSEKQGKVRNGFWFDNPSWYDPIDLNTAFGTEDHPVAHAFVFSCTTNVVAFNEFRPWLGYQNHQDTQFVELLGPEGAKIGGWSIEHFGVENNALSPTFVFYTNVLAKGAAFLPVNNATTNKGWGAYVLGCSGIEGRQEDLFPVESESNTSIDQHVHPFLNIPGAMRLRRSMGAYADKIVWGDHDVITDLEKLMGFTWANTMSGYDAFWTEDNIWSVFNREGEIGGQMVWRTTGSDTLGGYNREQERYLPWLEEHDEKPKILPELDRPRITEIAPAGDGFMRVSFQVRVLNGVALEADSGFTWDVERSAAVGEDEEWDSMVKVDHLVMPEVTAPADGTWSEDFSVRVPVQAGAGSRFYRITATAPKNH